MPSARQRVVGSVIVGVLAIRRGKSPLILGDLDPSPQQPRLPARHPPPTLNGEEPLNLSITGVSQAAQPARVLSAARVQCERLTGGMACLLSAAAEQCRPGVVCFRNRPGNFVGPVARYRKKQDFPKAANCTDHERVHYASKVRRGMQANVDTTRDA